MLYGVLEAAVVDGLLTTNPCRGTRLPRNERTREQRFLTEQQLTHLIACTDPYWQPLVTLLAGTGMRWGEVVGLRVRNVDLLAGTVRVVETLNEAEGHLVWETPGAVVGALLTLVVGRDRVDPVFAGRDGALVRHRNFNTRVWHKACAKAGLSEPRPTIHDLGHAHAAVLIAHNVPGGLDTIKDRLGHESITTTSNTYGYLLPRVREGVISALDGVFSGASPTTAPPIGETVGRK